MVICHYCWAKWVGRAFRVGCAPLFSHIVLTLMVGVKKSRETVPPRRSSFLAFRSFLNKIVLLDNIDEEACSGEELTES